MFGLKKILPRSLFARSLIILITPLFLAQVITTFIFFDNHWSRMTSRLAYAVAGEIAVISDVIESGAPPERIEAMKVNAADYLGLQFEFYPDRSFETSKPYEEDVSKVWEYLVGQKLDRELQQSVGRPFSLDVDFKEKQVYVDVLLTNGMLRVSMPERRLFSSSGYIVILWMIGASLLLLLIAVLFMRNQIKPIRKLAIAADRFGKGGDLVAFKPSGAKEVRQAAQAFIDMHNRIRRQVEQRTGMLAGVSHDLRTPLTRLRLQLEMLGDGPDVKEMRQDIQDMERMIKGYLDFARGAEGEQSSFTNVSGLLHKIAADFEKIGQSVSATIEDGVYMMLKPVAIERALSNIVNNAAQYGDQVWVRLKKFEDKVLIEVEDNGPGLKQQDYAEVFKPFYRTDKARKSEDGHVGLGLSVAQDIVHTHGGDIELGTSAHGGLSVSIILPA